MRVMVVSNIFPPHARGGYELGILEVARAFQRAGHEIEVVTSAAVGALKKTSAPTDVQVRPILEPVFAYESDMGEALDESSAWHQRRTEAFGGIVPGNVLAFAHELQSFRPDAIWIGNPLGLGPVGMLEAALSAGVPTVLHLMDDVDRYLLGYRRPLHWLARVRRLKRSITAVSCSALIRGLNSVVGSFERHHVVHNGFDFASVTKRARPGSHRAQLKLVYAGQVDPNKGISHLIAAAAEWARLAPEHRFSLDIIGPSSSAYTAIANREIHEAGLAHSVRLIGRLEKQELIQRLAEYDAAVMLLKDAEPFAYAPIEAAAVGLPVIVTRGRAVAEAFPADYPLFVEDRDKAGDVAAVLARCHDDRASLDRIGRHLRDHLVGRCDTETVIYPRYLDILASAPPPARPANIDGLLAGAFTCDAFGLAQDGWSVR